MENGKKGRRGVKKKEREDMDVKGEDNNINNNIRLLKIDKPQLNISESYTNIHVCLLYTSPSPRD